MGSMRYMNFYGIVLGRSVRVLRMTLLGVRDFTAALGLIGNGINGNLKITHTIYIILLAFVTFYVKFLAFCDLSPCVFPYVLAFDVWLCSFRAFHSLKMPGLLFNTSIVS